MTQARYVEERSTATWNTRIHTKRPLSRRPSDEVDGLHGPDNQRHHLHPPQALESHLAAKAVAIGLSGRGKEGVLSGSVHPLHLPRIYTAFTQRTRG